MYEETKSKIAQARGAFIYSDCAPAGGWENKSWTRLADHLVKRKIAQTRVEG